ncbi:MAG: hypothetical protein ABIO02_01660 [Patescibacteria group bacterium]
MANQIRGVIYLEKDKFQLSIDNRADIISYVFPPNLVSNMDIIDADQFKQNLLDFIKQSKMLVTNIVIVISSSTIFEQDFKSGTEMGIQGFLDNVPYETISIKKIPYAGGVKVLVGNATFYTLIADVFKQNNIHLDYVIPEQALGSKIASFNSSTARFILSQFESLAQNKFIIDASTEDKIEYKPPEKKVVIHKKNYTLLYTLPVFALLILVLVFMVLQPVIFKEKTNSKLLAKTVPTVAPAYIPVASPQVSEIPSIPVGSPSAVIQIRKIMTAQIIADPSSAAKAEQLKIYLQNIGIERVDVTNAASDIPNPVVLISNLIDQSETDKVVVEIKKLYPSIDLQSSSNQLVDLLITIGKTQ